jgi:DNA-binding response OmpR family regulator
MDFSWLGKNLEKVLFVSKKNDRFLGATDIKLLIVDDDSDIREMIKKYFEREGYEVLCTSNGKEGIELTRKNQFTIILLDVMMPQMDGYTMLTQLRTFCDTPVILLTAKGEQLSKIKGFTKGCDDYVVKPFDFAELSLRIQAILKRTNFVQNDNENTILRVKDLIINMAEHSVYKDKEEVILTPKEYEILCMLATNKGRVYSSKMLYESIWKESFLENDNSVITHMRNLREKIGDKAKEGQYIKTIWGVGYKIEKENQASC